MSSPEGERLLGKARDDQVAMLKLVGFHAQQAVEKALKSVLAGRGLEYPWTHDIRYLVERLDADVGRVPDDIRQASALTPWALEYRYGETSGGALNRDGTTDLVQAVLRWADRA